MKWMKATALKAALAAVVLCAPAGRASAQFVVEDPANLSQNITKFFRDVADNALQLQELMNAVGIDREQLAKTKEIWNRLDAWVRDGREYVSVLEQCERLCYDMDAVYDYIRYLQDSPVHSIRDLTWLVNMVKMCGQEVEDVSASVRSVLSASTSMTTAERLEELSDIGEELSTLCDAVEETVARDAVEEYMNLSTLGSAAAVEASFGVTGSSSEGSGGRAFDIGPEDLLPGGGLDTSGTEGGYWSEGEDVSPGGGLVDGMFALVETVVGCLAAVLLVWAFARRTREPQYADSLWKVLCGLVFILLLLQMLKVCVFDSGFWLGN